MSWKLIIVGVLTAAVLATIGLGYRHYTNVLDERDQLRDDVAKLELAVGLQGDTIATQAGVIGDWKDSQQKLLDSIADLRRVTIDASEETRRLNGIFSKHDLTELARRRPGLIERRINSGTDAALRLLECVSGAAGADCPRGGGASPGAAAAAQPPPD